MPDTASKRRSRLLLVAPWLAAGGADKFNLDLVRQLSAADWDVFIATTLSGDHSWSPLFAHHAREIVRLSDTTDLRKIPDALLELIQSRAPDVVLVSHSEVAYLLLPFLRAQAPDVTFVDYCHVAEPGWKRGGYARLSVEQQRFFDLTIVSSNQLKAWMVGEGADEKRVAVCHTCVDSNLWRPDAGVRARIRNELRISEDEPVILFAGRICEQKQPRVLAGTIAQLRDSGTGFIALIAGDGPDAEWLNGFVKEHSLETRVRLLGAVANDRVRELMQAADIFFLPSSYEGIALSIYEAMACGLPCVSANVGGQSELVTSDCGVLVSRGSEDQEIAVYARELTALLENPLAYRALGMAARQRVSESYRLEDMGSRMLQLLDHGQTLHATLPRTTPSRAQAMAGSRLAIKAVQIHESSLRWKTRGPDNMRVKAYQLLARGFETWYQWGIRRGWNWLPSLRARIRLLVLGKAAL